MAADNNPFGGDGTSGPVTPATPNYRAAQRRFEQHITINRMARRQRLLIIAVGAMSVVTLLVSGGAWLVTGYVSSSLSRLDAGTPGTPAGAREHAGHEPAARLVGEHPRPRALARPPSRRLPSALPPRLPARDAVRMSGKSDRGSTRGSGRPLWMPVWYAYSNTRQASIRPG